MRQNTLNFMTDLVIGIRNMTDIMCMIVNRSSEIIKNQNFLFLKRKDIKKTTIFSFKSLVRFRIKTIPGPGINDNHGINKCLYYYIRKSGEINSEN